MWIRNLMVALLLLHSESSAQGTSCSTNAPPSFCNFEIGEMCDGWKGGTDFNSPTLHSQARRLLNGENLTSDLACPTSTSSHCLKLDYLLFGSLDRIFIVFVWRNGSTGDLTNEGWASERTEIQLQNLPQGKPVQQQFNYTNFSLYNFTVKIERPTNTGSVLIDNITYEKAPCTVTTPSTTPTSNSVTATTVTTTTTTATTSTTTAAASPAIDTTFLTVPPTNYVSPEARPSSSTSVHTTEISHSAPPSSNNVGLIVGVVVAVIVLLVIGIVVFVVITRRRGMDFWKTCFSKKKANETDDITMDSVPSTAVLNMNGQSSNVDRGYENTSLQRDDYYNVIGDADAASPPPDPSSEYAKVNKPPKKTTTANRTSYENTDDLPPSNLAPGFEYNHLDFGKRPGTKAGVKPTAAANYSHIHTPREEHTDGAYSLARNPEGQNSASVNDATYQEPLKPAGVYHVLDRNQEDGRHFLNTDSANADSVNTYSANTDSVNTADIYHVPDDGAVETGNYANENSSSNVYHDPYDSSLPRQYQNDAIRYGNVEGESADVPHIPSSSSNVYHSIEESPESRPAKPQPPRKPVGVYELAKDPTAAAKKPTSPPKPNTAPHRPPPNTGTSVYHVLESPKSGMGDNYALAGPVGDSLPSSSVYQLAEPTQNTSHIQPSFSNDGDYNALDFNARNVPQKAEYVDTDSRAVYNHLNEGDGTYNETNKKPEVINDEYSHLS